MESPGKEIFKYVAIIFGVFLPLIFLFFRGPNTERSLFEETHFLMDTVVTVKVVSGEEKAARKSISKAFAEMERWAKILDRYNANSTIARINNKGESGVIVEAGVTELLTLALKYAELSKGAFDPTVAPLIDLWGFGKGKHQIPSPEEINQVLKLVDYRKLRVSTKDNKVFLPQEMSLDLGGIAKGFIIDRGIDVLKKQGIEAAYINAGGNIRVYGNKAPGRPWRLGIRNPNKKNAIFRNYILMLNQGSLATSGDYERFFIRNGIRYSHLIDPRTGYPARDLKAVTIYAPKGDKADLLSTVIFILGWEEGKNMIQKLPEVEGFMVNKNEIWYSPGLKSYFNG